MKNKLIITNLLAIGVFSSSAFADISHITTNATSAINVSLVVPSICNIIGLKTTEDKTIDPTSGLAKISDIKSDCNSKTATPKISFSSKNNFTLLSADTTKNSDTISYTANFGSTVINSSTAALDIKPTGEDLTMTVAFADMDNKKPDTYTDILTATISL